MKQEGEMRAKGKTKGWNRVARARRIAREAIMTLTMTMTMKQRRLDEDERRKNKIMMQMVAATIRNRKRKAAKLINDHNKRQPRRYVHHGIVCRVPKHVAGVIERCRWSSPMGVTNSAIPEEAWDGILPFDIMATNILPKLPVKLLARLRCVCKRLRYLTYDPCFAMQQLSRGADANHASTKLCHFSFAPHQKMIRMYNINGLNGNDIDGDRQIIEDVSFDFKFRGRLYMLSNSVNGLVCALCHDDSGSVGDGYPYLFNPITREVLPLPEISGCLDRKCGALALGFDSSSGQYKVLYSDTRSWVDTTFYVLTVGSREWRRLPEINCLVFSIMSVFLHGALHWQACTSGTRSSAILVFDVNDERFRLVPIPDRIASGISSGSYSLGVWKLNGHLSVALLPMAHRGGHGAGGTCLRMWKLEDRANPEWRREYDIDMTGCLHDAHEGNAARVIDVVCGKILIKWGPRLYAYDIEGTKSLNLITGCLPADLCFDVLKPSLVSPSSLPALL